MREVATASPAAARAVLTLYRAYRDSRDTTESLAERASGDEGVSEAHRLPSEEVNDFIQHHMNYFPELEEGAEALRRDAGLDNVDAYTGLARYLELVYGVSVRVAKTGAERGTLRKYDPSRKQILLSELLPTRSRIFQLANQTCLISQRGALDKLTRDAHLTTDESRTLGRVALANYFASALMMPYRPFLNACREERYDIDVIGRRFRAGFEQVCHRLTTLRRPGDEGVPFHMIRIDVAGNISKRFSGSGIRFARFSGACPRWNVFAAFLTPGMTRVQVSRMADGASYFCIARTVQKDSGGYHAQHPVQAIGLGCEVAHARQMVYSDGVDLENARTVIPVGVTCRLCERADCEQRAFPVAPAPAAHRRERARGFALCAGRGGMTRADDAMFVGWARARHRLREARTREHHEPRERRTPTMAIDEEFQKAQERVKSLPKMPSNDTLLELYALFKQASMGDAQGKRPGMLDIKGRAKFDAWTSRKGMSNDGAKQAYVALVERLFADSR